MRETLGTIPCSSKLLELIRNWEFRKSDFFETREGICRILPPLNQEIVRNGPKWRKLIGPIAEEIAQRLFNSTSKYLNHTFSNDPEELLLPLPKHRLPTPLTGSNRTNGRQSNPESRQVPSHAPKRKPRKVASWKLDCIRCGKQIDGKHRMYCKPACCDKRM